MPFYQAADRDGLEFGKSAIDACIHLLSLVKMVGELFRPSARDALCPGSGAAVEKAGLGVVE